jgi:uncharacterized protein (TIGR03086 family)
MERSHNMDGSEIDQLASALGKTESIIAGVLPGQGSLPTPCADFDVARLVDHVVGWATSFAARLTGGTYEGDPNDHRTGTEPAAEFHAASEKIVAAFRSGRAETEQTPVGMLLMEYVTHGWDLAIATGQPASFTAEEADVALSLGRQMLKPEYRGPGRGFGPETEVANSAGSVDKLVAFLGRSPGWQPA